MLGINSAAIVDYRNHCGRWADLGLPINFGMLFHGNDSSKRPTDSKATCGTVASLHRDGEAAGEGKANQSGSPRWACSPLQTE
jgi:hypothetical protein